MIKNLEKKQLNIMKHTFKETANIFEISTNTLNNWLKQKRETGTLERKYRSYKSKINEEDSNKYLKENPSAYQSEMAQYFKCDKSTVHGGRFTCIVNCNWNSNIKYYQV